jgi:hypothetical protein
MKLFPNGIDITSAERDCLLDAIPDIEAWVLGALRGKISKCEGRLITKWQPVLFADPEVPAIPASTDEFISTVMARPDYKNRAVRDGDP